MFNGSVVSYVVVVDIAAVVVDIIVVGVVGAGPHQLLAHMCF